MFNVRGRYYALKNVCPHQCGPLCLGPITGTSQVRQVPGQPPDVEWIRQGEILRCPWHSWEFDITTGRTVFRPTLRVGTYQVYVDSQVGDAEPVDFGGEPAGPTAPRQSSLQPAAGTEEPPDYVETYPVTVEDGWVILEA